MFTWHVVTYHLPSLAYFTIDCKNYDTIFFGLFQAVWISSEHKEFLTILVGFSRDDLALIITNLLAWWSKDLRYKSFKIRVHPCCKGLQDLKQSLSQSRLYTTHFPERRTKYCCGIMVYCTGVHVQRLNWNVFQFNVYSA